MYNIIKKITVVVATVFVGLFGLSACAMSDNSSDADVKPAAVENPITKVALSNVNTTLVVGEILYLDYAITPENSDEQLVITVGDTEIIELDDDAVIAKSVGETYVSLKVPHDKSNRISKTINIRVVEKLNYNAFEFKYSTNLERATVKVSCKRYNKNWLGKETNVYTVTGSGTIIKSVAYANYVLTDKSIFDAVSTKYEYEKWFVEDYLGKTYSISGVKYDINSGIAIGSFTSSSDYAVVGVFKSYAYKGDYAITAIGNPITDRISSTGYEKILSSTSHVFYHQSAASSKKVGVAVFNNQCEIIGMNFKYNNDTATAVSAIEIRTFIDRVFNGTPSGGGPIDIM